MKPTAQIPMTETQEQGSHQSCNYQRLFDESYHRVFGTSKISRPSDLDAHCANDFFDHFYWIFLERDPRIAQIFEGVDINKQAGTLKKTFFYAVCFIANPNSNEFMSEVAHQHDRNHLNIEPELYDIWLDCMVDTVKKFDSLATEETLLAWRLQFAPVIAYMRYMH